MGQNSDREQSRCQTQAAAGHSKQEAFDGELTNESGAGGT
jgi:hypothetical protein